MDKLYRIISSPRFILCFLATIIAVMKFRTYNEPLERDIGIYAVAASEIKHGKILYKDIWDHKPPALYFTYLLFELFFSKGELQIYSIYILFSVLLMLGIYFTSFELTNSRVYSTYAAIAYTIISGDLLTQSNQPNAELFINFSFAWSTLYYLKGLRNSQYQDFLISGAFSSLASMYKQYSIILPCALAFDFILFRSSKSRKHQFYALLLMFTPIVMIFIIASLYFHLNNALDDFIHMVFVHPFHYLTIGEESVSSKEKIIMLVSNFHNLFIMPIWTLLPLAFANLAVICIGLFKKEKKTFFLILLFFVAIIMIIAPWKFYPHYYQLLIPPLCIGFAYFISELSQIKYLQKVNSPFTIQNFTIIILILCLIIQVPNYFMNSDWWSHKKYGPIFIFCKDIGREISTFIKEDETFFQWGYEGTLYFYANRRPATGIFFNVPFIFSPQKDRYTKKTIEEFEKNPPALIVLPRHYSPDHPLIVWILEHYEPAHDLAERRKLEDAMIARASELCRIEKPILIQNPPTPPMYFYKPKSGFIRDF